MFCCKSIWTIVHTSNFLSCAVTCFREHNTEEMLAQSVSSFMISEEHNRTVDYLYYALVDVCKIFSQDNLLQTNSDDWHFICFKIGVFFDSSAYSMCEHSVGPWLLVGVLDIHVCKHYWILSTFSVVLQIQIFWLVFQNVLTFQTMLEKLSQQNHCSLLLTMHISSQNTSKWLYSTQKSPRLWNVQTHSIVSALVYK